MQPPTWQWREYIFRWIASIEPSRTPGGEIAVYNPQDHYAKRLDVPLNRYGHGPFCSFRVPNVPKTSGVYVYMIEGSPVYIGEAANLHSRFYAYGNISPKNCYKGGRETNCRINTLVRQTRAAGSEIHVYVMTTGDYKRIEAELIEEFQPIWNRKGVRA